MRGTFGSEGGRGDRPGTAGRGLESGGRPWAAVDTGRDRAPVGACRLVWPGAVQTCVRRGDDLASLVAWERRDAARESVAWAVLMLTALLELGLVLRMPL
jgi:hypothetical protein